MRFEKIYPRKGMALNEAITYLGIAYYQRGRYRDLKTCHQRIKHLYDPKAKKGIEKIMKAADPEGVLSVGVNAMFKQIQYYRDIGVLPCGTKVLSSF